VVCWRWVHVNTLKRRRSQAILHHGDITAADTRP
jgi:hypothetical protein